MKKYFKLILLFFLLTTVLLLTGCEEYAEKATEDLIGESGDSGDYYEVHVVATAEVYSSGAPVPKQDVRFDFHNGESNHLYRVTDSKGIATAWGNYDVHPGEVLTVEVSFPGSGAHGVSSSISYQQIKDSGEDPGSVEWGPRFIYSIDTENYQVL
jgi:hypothetical protein